MSRIARLSLLGAMVACLCAPAADAQSPSANHRVISGVVVSEASGQPLEGADVTLQDTNGFKLVAETSSDAEGRFSIPNLPNGKFALGASHRGFAPAGYEEHDGAFTAIVTGENQITTGLVLRLPPLGAIFGTVTEDSGDPVPHARLSLYRQVRHWGEESVQRANQTIADAMGNFEISPLPPGAYFLCAAGEPWYRPMNGPMAVSSAGAAAPPPRSPLDVAYSLTCYPETTDPAGAEPIRVDPGGRIEANVILHAVPALHILFQVKEHDPKQGFGGLGLQQSVFGFSDFVPVNQSFQQQGNGNDPGPVTVEISGVAPGQYELEFPGSNPSQETAHAASIQVSSGDLAVDASQLQPRASVSGKVIVPGEGDLPANSSVLLVNAQGEARGSGPLDAAGNFQMRDVPPGEYGVQFATNGVNLAVTQLQVKGARTDGPILEVANDPIELEVKAARPVGAINGFVTRNGKPASGVFVLLVEPKFAASRYGWLPNQSDSDGSFTFPGLLPGQYSVVAIEQGWTLDWRQPSVIDPYLAKGVQVTLEASSKKIDLQTPLEAQKIGGSASQ